VLEQQTTYEPSSLELGNVKLILHELFTPAFVLLLRKHFTVSTIRRLVVQQANMNGRGLDSLGANSSHLEFSSPTKCESAVS
jgi:hypothetical protein